MKKSDFIKKVLKHPENTVFTDPAQVEAVMLVFKSLGVNLPMVKGEIMGKGKDKDGRKYK